MTPYFSIIIEPPLRPIPSRWSTFSTPAPTSYTSRSRVTATPATPITPITPTGNKLIAITKVKIMILYKACKCDSSIAIRACGVAIL